VLSVYFLLLKKDSHYPQKFLEMKQLT